MAHSNMANVLEIQGHFSEAEKLYGQSLQLCEGAGDLAREALGLDGMGKLHWRRGNLDGALSLFSQALDIDERIGAVDNAANVLVNIGNVLQEDGRFADAESRYNEALVRFKEVGDRIGVPMALINTGDVLSCRPGAAIPALPGPGSPRVSVLEPAGVTEQGLGRGADRGEDETVPVAEAGAGGAS